MTCRNVIVILGLCFLLIDWSSFGEGGGSFGIERPRSKGGRILDLDGVGGS